MRVARRWPPVATSATWSAATAFFTALIRGCPPGGASSLDQWWSAGRCAAAWGDAVRPDGYAVWVEDGARLPFCFEYDNGTETLGRLEAKLARLRQAGPGRQTSDLGAVPVPDTGPGGGRPAGAGPPGRPGGHGGIEARTGGRRAAVAGGRGGGPRRRLADLGHPDRALALHK